MLRKFPYPDPLIPHPQDKARLRHISKVGGFGDQTWLDQLGLYGLTYSRLLQGKRFKPCLILQTFNLIRNPSLQKGRLFSGDNDF